MLNCQSSSASFVDVDCCKAQVKGARAAHSVAHCRGCWEEEKSNPTLICQSRRRDGGGRRAEQGREGVKLGEMGFVLDLGNSGLKLQQQPLDPNPLPCPSPTAPGSAPTIK